MSSASEHTFNKELLEEFSGAPFFLGTPFSDEDRAVIGSVVGLVPMLSTLLGKHCEIVVHSLEDPAHAVVAAANARISRRSVGDPIQREGLTTLLEKMNDQKAYFCRGSEGQALKAGISPLCNARGRCLGSLAVAMNLEAPLADVVASLSPGKEHVREEMRIFGAGPVRLEEVIAQTCEKMGAKSGVPARNRAKAVIAELYEKGVFNYRNAVPLVSSYTGISTVTVYWHLRELRKEAAPKA